MRGKRQLLTSSEKEAVEVASGLERQAGVVGWTTDEAGSLYLPDFWRAKLSSLILVPEKAVGPPG